MLLPQHHIKRWGVTMCLGGTTVHLREFRSVGNWRVLLSAFLYFDTSFMVWVLLGVVGTFIAEDLGLSATQKGLIAAIPALAGSGFRLVFGPLSDHIGSRRAGLIGLSLTLVPLVLGWLFVSSLSAVVGIGILLGVAGASFAVALPLVSRWYPPEHQGLALGIAGAGNSGTVLAALFAPRIAMAFGWQAVFVLALVPVLLTLAVFFALAKDSPNHPPAPPLSAYLRVLRRSETLWLCLLYSVTFGGFLGLSSYLGIFFHDQYGVSKVNAGDLTAACVFAGSLFRPIGGVLSDRFGGVKLLMGLLGAVALLASGLALLPSLVLALPAFVLMMGALGMGNGAVFQIIPQVFQKEIGVMTGLVGAAGGVGGFYLPTVLGMLKGTPGVSGRGCWSSGSWPGLRWCCCSWPTASCTRQPLATRERHGEPPLRALLRKPDSAREGASDDHRCPAAGRSHTAGRCARGVRTPASRGDSAAEVRGQVLRAGLRLSADAGDLHVRAAGADRPLQVQDHRAGRGSALANDDLGSDLGSDARAHR